jgi:hypothetical protein
MAHQTIVVLLSEDDEWGQEEYQEYRKPPRHGIWQTSQSNWWRFPRGDWTSFNAAIGYLISRGLEMPVAWTGLVAEHPVHRIFE